MASLPEKQVVEAVQRASKRSANAVHQEMKRGLDVLATVASTAPFLGLLATTLSIPNSFPGCGAERSVCMAAVFERLAQAMMPSAMGILVASAALACYRYLRCRLEAFDVEMQTCTLGLMNQLVRHHRRCSFR
jgi:biopolymer transport protein ExbB/biopolymer transport protein TolQ